MITGILRPTSGSIEFDGHAWKRSDLNHIGALIEMPSLYENLTAYENLKVRSTILGLTDKRIEEVLQIVRLTETGGVPRLDRAMGRNTGAGTDSVPIRNGVHAS